MTDQAGPSGFELILDNPRLILAFAVLIAVCGCFFVLGFIEGKRQGLQEGAQAAAESSAKAGMDHSQAQASKPERANPDAKASNGGTEEQPLDWYKNVNRRESEPGIVPPPAASDATSKIVEPAPPPKASNKPHANAAHSEPVTYAVQIGAFRQRKELEIRAQMLKSKGYDYRIESPQSPGQLYLLKVGKFASRAEAVAMQIRLKKSGFTSIIKTN
jgi:cell division protein FtsN